MSEDEKKIVVSQPKGTAFAVSGHAKADAVKANLLHKTDEPLVHMHLWNEQCVGQLEAKVRLEGNPDKPVTVAHKFENDHAQSHKIETKLSEPVHHALQMRTPLQVRFCNAWNVASDYSVSLNLRGKPFLNLRLTGATVATPQPCPEEDC